MKNLIMSSKVIIIGLVGITLLFLFACTPFPDNTDNTRSVSVQLIWNITAPNISSPFEGESLSRTRFGNKGEGNKLSIKASYDDIVKAGVTTVILKAEDSGNILKEKSFPVEARYGELNGLPAKNINIIAEARDGNKTLFRGAKGVDLIKNDFIQITITMNETPEYFANKATPAPPTPTPTPSSSIEMVNIPAGNFTMGSDTDPDAQADEKPQHTVTLSAYSISKYEITQGQYKQFMDATSHSAPTGDWDPVAKANYPVTYVDWDDAKAFCEWAGGRLPTEAEWEKAARGTDGRKYPWGNDSPTCSLLNYNYSCVGHTTSVGSYPSGASPYGVMDMAGNVWEWVNDWYDGSYYSTSPSSNPQGPSSGSSRVERGGGWSPYAGGSFVVLIAAPALRPTATSASVSAFRGEPFMLQYAILRFYDLHFFIPLKPKRTRYFLNSVNKALIISRIK